MLNLKDNGSSSLRTAIATANAHPGDTIQFANGLHGTITLTSGELLITANMTINGSGANQLSLSGGGSSRVFEIAANLKVNIGGLTIIQGYAAYEGGGILNDGSNLTLSGDDLTDNVVTESPTDAGAGATDLYANGGALDSLAGTLIITDCQITGNQALGASGPSTLGIAQGGGINVQGGSATISNSTIGDDLARGGDNSGDGGAFGGGLACYVPTTIMASTFSGNTAIGGNGGTGPGEGEGAGGAITTSGASVSITGSTFDHNRAIGGSDGNSGPPTLDPFVDYAFGGAINAEVSSNLSATCTSFSHNEAIGGNDSTTTGTDIIGVGGAEGGAVVNETGAVAAFSDCTFDHNAAIGGNGDNGSGPVILVGEGLGGAIVSGYGGGSLSIYGPTTLAVSNSTLTQNNAQGGDNDTGSATVTGLVGAGAGAGIANYLGGMASISGSELDHNQASGGHHNTTSGTGAVFAGLGAGGGIFNYLGNYNSPPTDYGPLNASVVTISGCTIDHNQAQGGGGSNGEGGGIANLLSATTRVTGTVLSQNQANGNGGAGLGGGATTMPALAWR